MVCGAHVRNEELGVESVKQTKKLPENVKLSLSHIQSLPTKRIRGLQFHCEDSRAFYITWPNTEFYKKRNLQGKSRYTGPRGVKPPIFLYEGSKYKIVVIEGEINCMSVKSVYNGPETICSPGPASQFPKFIDLYKNYKRVILILDKDPTGIAYGEETKNKLLELGKRCDSVYLDTDYNDTLVRLGKKALLEQLERDIV